MSRTIEVSERDSALIFHNDGTLEWHILREEFRNKKDDPKGMGILVVAIMVLCENDSSWQTETVIRAQKYISKMIGRAHV